MSIKSGFFTSKNNDRIYDGEDLGAIFDGILTEGVFRNYKKSLYVRSYYNYEGSSDTNKGSSKIVVESGKAWVNHSFVTNESSLILNFRSSGTWYVAIEFNNTFAVRSNNIILTRTLANNTTLKHIPLAKITVPSSLSVTQSDIQNLRGTSQCPFITAPLEIISADDILAQWSSQFNQFMSSSQDKFNYYLKTQAPSELLNEVNRLFNEYKSSLSSQWNAWFSSSKQNFKKQWDDWFKAMTDGKEEALDDWWDAKKEELVLSMIEEWDNWYRPFVEEKEQEFENWKSVYEQNTAQLSIDAEAFQEASQQKQQEMDQSLENFINVASQKTEELIQKADAGLIDVEVERNRWKELVQQLRDSNPPTLPYILDLEDSNGDKILDSDSNTIQSFNYVITL